ncbi:hypothetical protein [Xanthomonas citri]|uniref:hypothetical protein n=1 Tax=Xanthomonas citri TaxID=346 RepID=UPI000CCF0B9C|nr:hypothetical protein [Xanthomonas citri]PNV26414.1 hypothetical protein xavtCFBP7764_23855 [Xanthomonas citri]
MPDQIALLAQQLNEATRRGDLAGAYATLKGLRINDAARVALEAGFAVTSTQQRKPFFRQLEREIAEAARRRVDGWSLRQR